MWSFVLYPSEQAKVVGENSLWFYDKLFLLQLIYVSKQVDPKITSEHAVEQVLCTCVFKVPVGNVLKIIRLKNGSQPFLLNQECVYLIFCSMCENMYSLYFVSNNRFWHNSFFVYEFLYQVTYRFSILYNFYVRSRELAEKMFVPR